MRIHFMWKILLCLFLSSCTKNERHPLIERISPPDTVASGEFFDLYTVKNGFSAVFVDTVQHIVTYNFAGEYASSNVLNTLQFENMIHLGTENVYVSPNSNAEKNYMKDSIEYRFFLRYCSDTFPSSTSVTCAKTIKSVDHSEIGFGSQPSTGNNKLMKLLQSNEFEERDTGKVFIVKRDLRKHDTDTLFLDLQFSQYVRSQTILSMIIDLPYCILLVSSLEDSTIELVRLPIEGRGQPEHLRITDSYKFSTNYPQRVKKIRTNIYACTWYNDQTNIAVCNYSTAKVSSFRLFGSRKKFKFAVNDSVLFVAYDSLIVDTISNQYHTVLQKSRIEL